MSKATTLVGSVFLAVGILLLSIAGFALASSNSAAQTANSAAGIVVGFEQRSGGGQGTTYAPVVTWTDRDGETHQFTSSTASNPASFERGEQVDILYDPQRPGAAVIDTFWQRFTGIAIFGGIGLVFVMIGLPLVFLYLRRKQMIRWLKANGARIEAQFLRSEIDRSTIVNGRSPYRIFAQAKHPRTGKVASFKSEPLWVDLTSQLRGSTVPVFINPAKHGPHYIDLSEWLHGSESA